MVPPTRHGKESGARQCKCFDKYEEYNSKNHDQCKIGMEKDMK